MRKWIVKKERREGKKKGNPCFVVVVSFFLLLFLTLLGFLPNSPDPKKGVMTPVVVMLWVVLYAGI